MRARLLAVLAIALLAAGCTEGQKLGREVLDVPVPEGGKRVAHTYPRVLVLHEQPSSASVRYEYPANASERELLDALDAAVRADGWEVTLSSYHENAEPHDGHDGPTAHLSATRGDKRLMAEIGRWEAAGGGCCGVTGDPTRPLGIYLALLPPPPAP